MVFKVAGVVLALLLVASALAGWPLWIAPVVTAAALILLALK